MLAAGGPTVNQTDLSPRCLDERSWTRTRVLQLPDAPHPALRCTLSAPTPSICTWRPRPPLSPDAPRAEERDTPQHHGTGSNGVLGLGGTRLWGTPSRACIWGRVCAPRIWPGPESRVSYLLAVACGQVTGVYRSPVLWSPQWEH